MKPVLLAAALLLALASLALADDPETCVGRVKIHVETVGDGLYPKGDRLFVVGNCVVTAPREQVLRTCPMGSWCRIAGTSEGDGEVNRIDSVMLASATSEYQEGLRDWRRGQCYQARPYIDHGPEQQLWERGYDAGAKKYPKRDMSSCHLGSHRFNNP